MDQSACKREWWTSVPGWPPAVHSPASPQGFSKTQIFQMSHKKAFNIKKQYTIIVYTKNKKNKKSKTSTFSIALACTIAIKLGHAGIVDLSV